VKLRFRDAPRSITPRARWSSLETPRLVTRVCSPGSSTSRAGVRRPSRGPCSAMGDHPQRGLRGDRVSRSCRGPALRRPGSLHDFSGGIDLKQDAGRRRAPNSRPTAPLRTGRRRSARRRPSHEIRPRGTHHHPLARSPLPRRDSLQDRGSSPPSPSPPVACTDRRSPTRPGVREWWGGGAGWGGGGGGGGGGVADRAARSSPYLARCLRLTHRDGNLVRGGDERDRLVLGPGTSADRGHAGGRQGVLFHKFADIDVFDLGSMPRIRRSSCASWAARRSDVRRP